MKRLVDLARGVTRIIGIAETILGSLLMAMIFALMLLQVAQRYLPIGPGVWVGELARFGLVWLTFALAGYLVSRSGHVTIDVIDTWLKGEIWQRGIMAFVHIVLTVIGVLFAIDAWALIQNSGTQTTPVMSIPMALIYIIPTLGMALSALHALVRAVSAFVLPLDELTGEAEEESLATI